MKLKRASFVFFTLFVSLVAVAQIHQPVTFSVKQHRLSDTEVELRFEGQMEQGWHVYGTDIPDGGPTRAELTLEKVVGLKPSGALRATGQVKRQHDAMFDMDVSFMEGCAAFSQKFVITAPDYEVTGYLTYGACSSTSCLPPANVEFAFTGKGLPAAPTATPVAASDVTPDSSEALEAPLAPDSLVALDTLEDLEKLGELGQLEKSPTQKSGWWIFLMGFLGGLAALLTPCVWPIIPMTVSFFLKKNVVASSSPSVPSAPSASEAPLAPSSKNRKAVRDALIYGLSIVAIYMIPGVLVTLLYGASALNALSTNAGINIFFFLVLVFFGLSFLGGFDISLPGSWTNAVDSKASQAVGLFSIFLMAFTLVLVSFSCTGPIIGFLLVEVASSGQLLGPAIGMFGFALALALPFTLFALFPSWLKRVPKSGNWMNCIKVSLGFLELAFSLKFLSVADLAYGWHILDREVFLSLWIVLFALLGAYYIGWIRFPHDEEEYDEMGEKVLHSRTSITRFLLAVASFSFSLYMVPGLWGAPCKAVSAFAPPMSTQDWSLTASQSYGWGTADADLSHSGGAVAKFNDYDQGLAYAREHGKPVFLDFTGYGCVNCRKMEAAVFAEPEVKTLLDNQFVVITLWVDDKTRLPEPLSVDEYGRKVTLRTMGDRWSYLQRAKFGANAQPFYIVVDADGNPLTSPYGYDEDVEAFLQWLRPHAKL